MVGPVIWRGKQCVKVAACKSLSLHASSDSACARQREEYVLRPCSTIYPCGHPKHYFALQIILFVYYSLNMSTKMYTEPCPCRIYACRERRQKKTKHKARSSLESPKKESSSPRPITGILSPLQNPRLSSERAGDNSALSLLAFLHLIKIVSFS